MSKQVRSSRENSSYRKKHHKYRIKWSRFIVFIILILLLVFVSVKCVSGCDGKDSKPDDKNFVVNENAVAPSKVKLRGDEPPTGEDRSVRGIPDLKDVLLEDDGDLLVLVNKYHGVAPEYEPEGLVQVDLSMVTWDGIYIKKEAYDAFKELFKDAEAQGFTLCICSGYRTYDYQQELFLGNLESLGEEEAYIFSAYPGRSEHHTGLAIDLTTASMGWSLGREFADSPEGRWVSEHCQDYGFILRYPEGKEDITGYGYEPWHFRYVGKEAAKDIMSEGITFEEYLGEA